MAVSTIAQEVQLRVSIGVDTHLDTHVAVAKDGRGRTIGRTDIPTTPAGYRQMLAWAQGLGEVDGWAVEGTGSYGAGLARFLRKEGQLVTEVIRPTARPVGTRTSRTPSTPRRPHVPCRQKKPSSSPRPATTSWRRSAACASPGDRR
jgi:hypothetical protein